MSGPLANRCSPFDLLPPSEPGGEELPGVGNIGLVSSASSVNARHAISDDGSRVFWTADNGHLYMRDMVSHKTLQLDVPEPECPSEDECGEGAVDPEFQEASSSGSRVFFADTQKLTAHGGAYTEVRNVPNSAADLYECKVEEVVGELKCNLSDLAPSGGQLGSVLGSSEDGSWMYFVANGVLANGGVSVPGAVAGTCPDKSAGGQISQDSCNLYVRHDGVTSLVAVLSGGDFPDWSPRLVGLTARVSPDGEWLAFMSQRSLTGYDNRDAVSGEPDEEVYLYDARTGGLVCASCDPTGGRPHGVQYSTHGNFNMRLAGGNSVWPETAWLAGNIPTWTPYTQSSAVYQSRYLSDSGRLFFNSRDGLVPKDVNGNEDVYEYEPQGVGSQNALCGPGAAGGGEVFKPERSFEVEVEGKSEEGAEGSGCVGLISSGSSPQESAFLDASETGGDVFFLTTEKLASQDFDTSYDVYDAQECTTLVPCLEASAAAPPACASEASCKAAPSPQPEIFGPSGSATFSGAGNLIPPQSVVVKPRTAAQFRAERLAKALKVCKKDRSKKKRAACEKQARKRYGVLKAKKASNDRRAR